MTSRNKRPAEPLEVKESKKKQPIVALKDREPDADAQSISISTLSLVHSDSWDYILDVRVAQKTPFKIWTDKKVFNVIFQDADGDRIVMSSWGSKNLEDDFAGQLYKHCFKENEWYRLSNFQVKVSDAFNKSRCPCPFMLNAKDNTKDNDPSTRNNKIYIGHLPGYGEHEKVEVKFIESIESLLGLYQRCASKSTYKDKTTAVLDANFPALCVECGPKTTVMTKAQGAKEMMKVSFADESNHRISWTIWEMKDQQDFRVGQIYIVQGAGMKWDSKGNSYELCDPSVQLVPAQPPSENVRIASLQRWARTAEIDPFKYIDLSHWGGGGNKDAAAGGGGGSNTTNPPISASQLATWQTQSKVMLQQLKQQNQLSLDAYGKPIIPKEISDQIPHEIYSVLGYVESFSAPSFPAPPGKEKEKTQLPIFYCACPDPVHKQFKKKVEYKVETGTYWCDKCQKNFENCSYGFKCSMTVSTPTGTISGTLFSIESLLPGEFSNLAEFILACKNAKYCDPGSAELPFADVSHLVQSDCEDLTAICLSALNSYVSHFGKLTAFAVKTEPSCEEGLSVTFNGVRAPNYEQEGKLLTTALEQPSV